MTTRVWHLNRIVLFLSSRCPPALTHLFIIISLLSKKADEASKEKEPCRMFAVAVFNLQPQLCLVPRLHELTESCTREKSASYQSALSGLPWYASSTAHLPRNECWLTNHTLIPPRYCNEELHLLKAMNTRTWNRYWNLRLPLCWD